MALLRLSNGRIYTSHQEIGSRIGTVKIGKFDYPEDFRREVAKLSTPLTEEGIEFITSRLDPDAVKFAADQGLVYRRIGSVVPPQEEGQSFIFAFGKTAASTSPNQMTEAQLRAYTTPHIVEAVDFHFVMSGAIVKGLKLEDDLQGVLYVQPGEWIWLTPEAINWPIFPYGEPTIGVSYFAKEIGTFGQVNFEDVKILPEMAY